MTAGKEKTKVKLYTMNIVKVIAYEKYPHQRAKRRDAENSGEK